MIHIMIALLSLWFMVTISGLALSFVAVAIGMVISTVTRLKQEILDELKSKK